MGLISGKSKELSVGGYHVAGLPITEGILCSVHLLNDKAVFLQGNNKFSLAFEKINDVSVKTETEIHQSYVSSIGGTVGGAMLFGPLGAIVCGRAKKKKIKEVSCFIIFNYCKNNNAEFISFEIANPKGGGEIAARKIVTEFRALHGNEETREIEL